MCGIIGYVGKKDAKTVILNGLKKLEYRGYDSAGIACFCNGKMEIIKSKGKIAMLESAMDERILPECHVGIGHTRWATHGIPNEINCHPHTCENVTLVHNGIIENYETLRNELKLKGYTFRSETDTEVAAATIADEYEGNKLDAIISATKKIRGSYAFGIIFEDEKNSIYAVRKDSPLIVALSDDGNFIASDVPAILEYTNKYILLETNEIAVIEQDKVTIYNDKKEVLNKDIQIANFTMEEAAKGGYEHFMLKEIHEEPTVIKNCMLPYVADGIDALNDKLPDLSNYDNIHIVACGSAMHTGLIAKHLFETYANIPVTVEVASEYRYKNPLINIGTLVIIISQSGETADTLAAMRIAKEKGATTLALVNVVGSSIAREADETVYTLAGPEIAVATTKAYLSQVATLTLLALNLSYTKGLMSKEEAEAIITDITKLPDVIETIVNNITNLNDIARVIAKHDDVFFIGRGIDYALCMEGSLKLKEISYIHSEAYAAGELKHGTISLISDGTPVIAINTRQCLSEKTISNIKEVKSRGAHTIYLTTDSIITDSNFYDQKIILPTLNEFVMPIITVVPLQCLSYEVAKLRGCDIDKPKNLAKSVTVE